MRQDPRAAGVSLRSDACRPRPRRSDVFPRCSDQSGHASRRVGMASRARRVRCGHRHSGYRQGPDWFAGAPRFRRSERTLEGARRPRRCPTSPRPSRRGSGTVKGRGSPELRSGSSTCARAAVAGRRARRQRCLGGTRRAEFGRRLTASLRCAGIGSVKARLFGPGTLHATHAGEGPQEL